MLAGVHEFESCTDLFLRRADGAVLYGHNEDGPYAPDNCAIARYSGVRRGFTEFSAAESIPGYTFLWNDAGLVTSVNFIHLERRRYDEPSAHFLLRDAAEASSIEEIREKLSGATCASAFSLNVYDHKTCRAYNVEFLYDQLDILEVTDRYAHANHLIRLGEGYARPGSDTKPRLKKRAGAARRARPRRRGNRGHPKDPRIRLRRGGMPLRLQRAGHERVHYGSNHARRSRERGNRRRRPVFRGGDALQTAARVIAPSIRKRQEPGVSAGLGLSISCLCL